MAQLSKTPWEQILGILVLRGSSLSARLVASHDRSDRWTNGVHTAKQLAASQLLGGDIVRARRNADAGARLND
jgi:hypothetical protein